MASSTIRINTKGATTALAKVAKQIPFAVAQAVNATARRAAADANAAMPSVFEHANRFTQMAVGVPLLATKSSLTAVVAIKPLQGKYLGLEVLGGTRTPADNTRIASSALVLPGNGPDPLPAGRIKLLTQQIQTAATQRQAIAAGTRKARRGNGSRGVFKMSGRDPFGDGGAGGIWRRLPGHRVTRLVSFEATARYKPKWDFNGQIEKSVTQSFQQIFAAAIERAMRTAK